MPNADRPRTTAWFSRGRNREPIAMLTGWLKDDSVARLQFELKRPDLIDKDQAIAAMDRALRDLRRTTELDGIDLDQPYGHSAWFRLVVTDDGQAQIQHKVEGVQDIPTRGAAPHVIARKLNDGVSRALSDNP